MTRTRAEFLLVLIVLHNAAGFSLPIDLSWPYDNNTIYWGDGPKFQFTSQIRDEGPDGNWYALNVFMTSEHAGTHLDAPFHFSKNGWKVADIPLERLITRGIKIDLSFETERLGSNARLLPHHLIDWERRNGCIPHGALILVYFNWSKYYLDRFTYLGGSTPSEYKFPGVSAEAAQWLINKRNFVGVGVDTASIDPGVSVNFEAHRIFLNENKYHLENVKIPANLPEKGFDLYVMPMKIGEGTGAPVRINAHLKSSIWG